MYSSTSSSYDLIYLNDYYYIITADITAPVDGNQTITISHKRQNTSPLFASTSTVETHSDATGRRRMWSGIVENMGVTQIDTTLHETSTPDDTIKRNNLTIETAESDINGLEYLLSGENYGYSIKGGEGR